MKPFRVLVLTINGKFLDEFFFDEEQEARDFMKTFNYCDTWLQDTRKTGFMAMRRARGRQR